MKKACPYCHDGKLTLRNTFNYYELLHKYSTYLKGFIGFRPHLDKNVAVIYRRYFCDNCGEYVWSYEEFIHKVPKRGTRIEPPISVYKDGKHVYDRPAKKDVRSMKHIEDEMKKNFLPMPEDILNEMRSRDDLE